MAWVLFLFILVDAFLIFVTYLLAVILQILPYSTRFGLKLRFQTILGPNTVNAY